MTQARITVTITGDTLGLEGITLTDAALASFVGETPEDERPQLVERALRIGLLTLCNAGVSMSADVVKAEFERLYERMEATQESAAKTLATTLREHFGDGEGRLPKTLERFLGDDGQLRRLTHDLFDESKRDSAIGRLNDLLGKYFDGDSCDGRPASDRTLTIEAVRDSSRVTYLQALRLGDRVRRGPRGRAGDPRPHHPSACGVRAGCG